MCASHRLMETLANCISLLLKMSQVSLLFCEKKRDEHVAKDECWCQGEARVTSKLSDCQFKSVLTKLALTSQGPWAEHSEEALLSDLWAIQSTHSHSWHLNVITLRSQPPSLSRDAVAHKTRGGKTDSRREGTSWESSGLLEPVYAVWSSAFP